MFSVLLIVFSGSCENIEIGQRLQILDVCLHKVPFINGMTLHNFSHST